MRYTRKLEKFVDRLSRVMTLRDATGLAGVGWDTAKEIAKRRLRRAYGRISLRGVRHLSMDEVHVGKRGYYTLVLDLESGGFCGSVLGAGRPIYRAFGGVCAGAGGGFGRWR